MTACIGSIVEGHGEINAVPELLRRIASVEVPEIRLLAPPVHRVNKSALLRSADRELERAIDLLARKVRAEKAVRRGLLVIIDSDGDPPCKLGPTLRDRARSVVTDIPLAVVCAHPEYEAWFRAAADSLRGLEGLPADLRAPPDPEQGTGAKQWLIDRMKPHGYSPTTHQKALTKQFDLTQARRARSFDRLYKKVVWMLKGE